MTTTVLTTVAIQYTVEFGNHGNVSHRYAVTCVSVHPSGKLALSVGKDRTVR